jgi:hypothetical protein
MQRSDLTFKEIKKETEMCLSVCMGFELRQVLYALSYTPVLFCLSYFSDKAPCFLPWASL